MTLCLDEKLTAGKFDAKHRKYCDKGCTGTVTEADPKRDALSVTAKSKSYSMEKRFKLDGTSATVVDARSKGLKPSNYIRVDAAFGKNFTFNYLNDSSQ